jgi:chitodextrinase
LKENWEETHPDKPYDGWNPGEDVLMSMLGQGPTLGAVMGTDIKDICDYIGGAKEGDDIAHLQQRRVAEGLSPTRSSTKPHPRQGPAVLCWYSGSGSGPDAQEAQGQGYPDTGYVVRDAHDLLRRYLHKPLGLAHLREQRHEGVLGRGVLVQGRGDYWSAAGTSGKMGISEIRIYSQEDPPEEPFADFTTNVTGGTIPLAVQFTDTSEGEPETWEWNFGDGSTSTEQNPVHTYTKPGTYTITLTVTNAAGSDSTENTVTAGSISFTASVTSGTVPLTVEFTDTSGGEPEAWEWDFGDGETSDEQNPTHTYETAGTYDVHPDGYLRWQQRQHNQGEIHHGEFGQCIRWRRGLRFI